MQIFKIKTEDNAFEGKFYASKELARQTLMHHLEVYECMEWLKSGLAIVEPVNVIE